MIAPRRFCFARPLLPFGSVGKAYAHCTHLQIAQADPTDQNLQKSAISLPSSFIQIVEL